MARKNDNRRVQISKSARERANVQRVLGLRSSNAAQPVRSGMEYRRAPKHKGAGWDE